MIMDCGRQMDDWIEGGGRQIVGLRLCRFGNYIKGASGLRIEEGNANYFWNYIGQALRPWRLQDLPFPKR